MKSPRVYQTDAIILKRIKLGEADRIITFYTADHGKSKAVAKGTRRPKSKLGGHVELLTYSRLLIAKGRNLDIITQAQTIDSFISIKDDLNRMSCGLYILELVDSFTEESIENHQLFDLLLDSLHQLSQTTKFDTFLRYFEIHLLDCIGYRPQFQQCANCNSSLSPITNSFSPAQGGVLCTDCSYMEPITTPISLNALKVLRVWQNSDFTSAIRININTELSQTLDQIMREYIKFMLERQVKSTSWLDKTINL
jgi:DNA repair protein RecO (recombination protein O)